MLSCFMGNKTQHLQFKFFLNFISLAALSTVDKNPFFLELHGSKPNAAQITFIS